MTLKKLLPTLGLAITLATGPMALNPLTATSAFAGPPTLEQMQEKVRKDYRRVAQLDPSQLEQALAEGDGELLLIDVRELDEFAVSRLPGAVQVAPNVRKRSFVKNYADLVKGKKVIFYCSVGVRSSALAQKVQKDLKELGAEAVYNLDGGVFGWHNQQRPGLVNAGGQTDLVHPYDDYWGELLTGDRALISYTPSPE